MSLKVFPWENNVKESWTNRINGLTLYVDDLTTNKCSEPTFDELPTLNAKCYCLVDKVSDNSFGVTRVLIDTDKSEIITILDSMASMVDKIYELRSLLN